MKFKQASYIVVFSFFIAVSSVSSKDLLSGIFGNAVATLGDAAELLYNSFHLKKMAQNKKRQDDLKKGNKHYQKENSIGLKEYLKKSNINTSQPISKQDFAKLLFERFANLPVSFLTATLKFNSLYFKDAQKLNIFKSNDVGKETLTKREMLAAFLKADQLSN